MTDPVMMARVHFLSDLHLEFAAFSMPEVAADVLVLAGDVGPRMTGLQAAQQWSERYPVIYVPGNHEYYREAIPRHTQKLLEAADGSRVHVLDNREIVLAGIRFLGCTLWTDFDLFGDTQRLRCMLTAESGMNDYRLIRHTPGFSKLKAAHTRQLHLYSRNWLQEQLAVPFEGPTVVVTHHAPSLRSVAPERQDDPLSAAYASNLDHLLDGRVAVWLHGHTHTATDYTIGGTRVVTNARGYPDETTGYNPELVLEV